LPLVSIGLLGSIAVGYFEIRESAAPTALRLLPIASGHREEKDKRLVLTTKYTTIVPRIY
jgi:hypothetical protein